MNKMLKGKKKPVCLHPTRNASGSSSGWNKKMPDSNSKPKEEIRNITKDNYLGKYKRKLSYFWHITFSTYDLKGKLKQYKSMPMGTNV